MLLNTTLTQCSGELNRLPPFLLLPRNLHKGKFEDDNLLRHHLLLSNFCLIIFTSKENQFTYVFLFFLQFHSAALPALTILTNKKGRYTLCLLPPLSFIHKVYK